MTITPCTSNEAGLDPLQQKVKCRSCAGIWHLVPSSCDVSFRGFLATGYRGSRGSATSSMARRPAYTLRCWNPALWRTDHSAGLSIDLTAAQAEGADLTSRIFKGDTPSGPRCAMRLRWGAEEHFNIVWNGNSTGAVWSAWYIDAARCRNWWHLLWQRQNWCCAFHKAYNFMWGFVTMHSTSVIGYADCKYSINMVRFFHQTVEYLAFRRVCSRLKGVWLSPKHEWILRNSNCLRLILCQDWCKSVRNVFRTCAGCRCALRSCWAAAGASGAGAHSAAGAAVAEQWPPCCCGPGANRRQHGQGVSSKAPSGAAVEGASKLWLVACQTFSRTAEHRWWAHQMEFSQWLLRRFFTRNKVTVSLWAIWLKVKIWISLFEGCDLNGDVAQFGCCARHEFIDQTFILLFYFIYQMCPAQSAISSTQHVSSFLILLIQLYMNKPANYHWVVPVYRWWPEGYCNSYAQRYHSFRGNPAAPAPECGISARDRAHTKSWWTAHSSNSASAIAPCAGCAHVSFSTASEQGRRHLTTGAVWWSVITEPQYRIDLNGPEGRSMWRSVLFGDYSNVPWKQDLLVQDVVRSNISYPIAF